MGAATAAGGERTAEAPGLSERRPTVSVRRWLRERRWTIVVSLLISLFAWPFPTIIPGTTGDFSWMAALSFAADQRMAFGDELVWTYGPLGFFSFGPMLFYADVALLAFLWQALLQVALAATTYLAARRFQPTVVAVLLSFVVTTLVPERAVALGFMWCLLALLSASAGRRGLALAVFPAAIGALTAIQLLGKLNQGVEVAAMAVVVLATMPGRRRADVAWFVAAFAVVGASAWFATGQGLDDLLPYVANGKEIVSGYAAAMGAAAPQLVWQFGAAAVLVALGTIQLLSATRSAPTGARAGALLCWAIYVFLGFKAGFVRHDGGHVVIFFGNLLVLFAIAAPATREMARVALVSLTLGVVVFSASTFYPFRYDRVFDPVQNAKAAFEQTRLLVSGSRRNAARDELRAAFAEQNPIPAPVFDAIGGRTVAFWPNALGGLVYTYDLDWRPPPVFEAYSAFTPKLDQLEADFFASERAPERVLRRLEPSTDNRVPSFESPLATLELLCRYREVARAEPWQALARAADRCGEQRVVSTVEAGWGDVVHVPAHAARGRALLVRVSGAQPRGLERLRSLLLRPHRRLVSLDGAAPQPLVWETAVDGVLLRAPVGADFAPPFNLAPGVETIAVSREDGGGSGKLRYTFVEQSIARAGSR